MNVSTPAAGPSVADIFRTIASLPPAGYGGGGGGGSGGGIGPPLASGFVPEQATPAAAPAPPTSGVADLFTPKNLAIAAGLVVGAVVLKKVLHA
jgi:hypothetical protein